MGEVVGVVDGLFIPDSVYEYLDHLFFLYQSRIAYSAVIVEYRPSEQIHIARLHSLATTGR